MEPSTFTPPTSPVMIELGDGIERPLRYSIKSVRRLKEALGKSMNTTGVLSLIDEDAIAVVIFEGLRGPKGEDPEGITIEQIEELPAARMSELINKLNEAYFGSRPKKNEEPMTEARALELIRAAATMAAKPTT